MTDAVRGTILILVAVAACACAAPSATVAPGGSPATVTQAPNSTAATTCAGNASAEDVAHARALIDAADLADDPSITAIQEIRSTAAGTLAACQRLGEGVVGDPLWAAAWVYGTGGDDPAPLLALLGNEDPTIRAIAAAGAASLGGPEGLDALAALIAVDAGLRGSLPPVTVARFAAYTLSGLVDGAADSVGDVPTGTPEERSAATVAWTSWLEANRARVTFDPEQHAWHLR